MLLKLLVLVIISGAVGALIGNMQRKSVEGYYYKVGMAHQFMPGTMSCPDSGTINCNDCQKPKSCYSY